MAIFWTNPRDQFADIYRLAEDFEVGGLSRNEDDTTTLLTLSSGMDSWTVSMLLTKLNLVVCCDRSDAGQQSWMNHSQTVPTCFGQKTGQLCSPNSVLSENDSSCMQGINCMSCEIYPRSNMPIMRGDAGDVAKIFLSVVC